MTPWAFRVVSGSRDGPRNVIWELLRESFLSLFLEGNAIDGSIVEPTAFFRGSPYHTCSKKTCIKQNRLGSNLMSRETKHVRSQMEKPEEVSVAIPHNACCTLKGVLENVGPNSM